MTFIDRPCWRYRMAKDSEVESKLFEAPEHAPEHEGWVDSPAKVKPKDISNGKEASTESRKAAEDAEGQGREVDQGEVLSFEGLTDEQLREIAGEAGVKIDGRWGRARLEQALRDAK